MQPIELFHNQKITTRQPKLRFIFRLAALIFLSSLYGTISASASASGNENLVGTAAYIDDLVNRLPKTKLRELPELVDELSAAKDVRLFPLFESMLAGKLYFRKSDKTVLLITNKKDKGVYQAKGVLSGDMIESIGKKEIKKIRVNNKLRKQLRKVIAKITLFGDDPKRRLEAVEKLIGDLNHDNLALIKQAKQQEKDSSVIKKIDLALAIANLDSDTAETRRSALTELAGELHPAARNRLKKILAKDESGAYLEHDKTLVTLAQSAIKKIEGKLSFYSFLERVFFGLSLGSVLLLAAIGLSITFGVMGVINMAHGELLMLGAYTTYVIQQIMPNHIGISILVAIPSAFLVCGLVGIAIERGVIKFLKGRPLETLLATFGVSLVLQQAVRSIFSPLNRQVNTPEWMSGALEINPALALTYNRLYIIIFSLLVFAILLFVMKKTSLGLYVRAVSQNRNMAKAVGIRSEWIDAMTFGLGSGVAGVAGVALSQLTNVGPNLGQAYIIDSFMVVVFGGVGNLWGTLVAAFSLGIFGKFLEPITGAVLAQIFVLVFIVLFIQKRPRGLFPQRGRAAE